MIIFAAGGTPGHSLTGRFFAARSRPGRLVVSLNFLRTVALRSQCVTVAGGMPAAKIDGDLLNFLRRAYRALLDAEEAAHAEQESTKRPCFALLGSAVTRWCSGVLAGRRAAGDSCPTHSSAG